MLVQGLYNYILMYYLYYSVVYIIIKLLWGDFIKKKERCLMQTASRREMKSRKRQVLVVDDELINRQLLGHILKSDYDVLYAENGKEALDIINSNYKTLSLVLLDLLMPEIDGYELLEIIGNDESYRKIPVIVLTSEKSAEVKSLQLGAVDFIPKPYDMPEVIRARVKRSIALAEDNMLLNAVEDDSLTGLYNKEFFYQYAYHQDMFHPELETDFIVINVNRFHLINELYGRNIGNELLRIIADSIREILRDNIGVACRNESDSFNIYITHQSDYQSIVEQFDRNISEGLPVSNISLRFGVYENCDKAITMDQRIDRATLVGNTLRNSYSTAFAVYDNELYEKELFRAKLVSEVDRALEEKQFKVFYQPKYNIKGDNPRLSSAEALIRWQHPEFGLVSPGVFIPLFEENGLIQKLDEYVWSEAAAQISRWKQDYGFTLPVSVNVSRVDVFNPELENKLLSIVKESGISSGELMLEITESAYTQNASIMIEIIKKLRRDGFKIEMDDFGSGYSSLNMLSAMPVDVLKLDMKFIRTVCEDEKTRKMVELILDIAKFLKVPVVAEGVETEQQCNLLKQLGCDVVQGYFFSKPVPAQEFNGFIKKELSN